LGVADETPGTEEARNKLDRTDKERLDGTRGPKIRRIAENQPEGSQRGVVMRYTHRVIRSGAPNETMKKHGREV